MKNFNSENEASEWLFKEEIKDENCVDNYRFAFKDDEEALVKYETIKADGCCGYCDCEIIVAGRAALIGCNYGH